MLFILIRVVWWGKGDFYIGWYGLDMFVSCISFFICIGGIVVIVLFLVGCVLIFDLGDKFEICVL
ncbi:hypothetical protein DF186_20420 [Enterococcus hirae]|nr:hypothetical protein DF186_20420 [Enterococcus hirae]